MLKGTYMDSKLKKNQTKYKCLLRTFLQTVNSHICMLSWQCMDGKKCRLAPRFSCCVLTRLLNLLKWVFLSLPQLCVICDFSFCMFFYLAGTWSGRISSSTGEDNAKYLVIRLLDTTSFKFSWMCQSYEEF